MSKATLSNLAAGGARLGLEAWRSRAQPEAEGCPAAIELSGSSMFSPEAFIWVLDEV
jgi:hypothetical protein